MQRNLMLVESLESKFTDAGSIPAVGPTTKADEVVRLYEILIENLTELNNIRDTHDEKANKAFAARLLSFKALRCLYLGHTYAIVSKWPEASALFERCQHQIKDALDHHRECEPMDIVMVEKLNKSLSHVSAQHSRVHALGFLESINQRKAAQLAEESENKPQNVTGFLDNLNNYDASFLESGKIIEFPPNFEPMPCKPLLFDLALLSITFPNLTERKKAPRTGIFARWWGNK